MIEFLKEHMQTIFVVIATALAIILLCCTMVLVGNFRTGLSDQALDAANHYHETWQDDLDEAVGFYVKDAQKIAAGIPEQETEAVVYLDNVSTSGDGIARSFRLYRDGKVFSAKEIDSDEESRQLGYLHENNTLAVSGAFIDPTITGNCFAVYVPTEQLPSTDGLAVLYPLDSLRMLLQETVKDGDQIPDVLCACSNDGNMFAKLRVEGIDIGSNDNNFFTELARLTNDKTVVNSIFGDIGKSKTTYVSISGTGYAVTVSPAALSNNALYIISIYNAQNIYENGYSLASTIGAIIVTVMLIIVAMAGYLIVSRLGLTRKMDQYDRTDPVFGCPNYPGFAKDAEEILSRNKASKFAVVYVKVVHFSYLAENFGSSVADETIRYLIKMIDKLLGDYEVFGKVNDDQFALLLHYSTVEKLQERLKLLNSFANNCPTLRPYNFLLKLNFGVYCIDREEKEHLSLQAMFDRASIASSTSVSSQNKEMRIYDDEIHDAFMHEAEIEAKMENALKTGEFKIFYQPKYRISANKIDGAEALVRWYDPENNRFRTPSEFLPLFEKNGFIAKLDRYVFTEVCKFVNEMRSRDYRMVSISVNVSRLTATEPGFLDFYINTKRKYGIPDKFIIVEFTESFAYENNEVINDIVSKLHAAGFRCSIDDFGTGFSSYNILKSLPMDEIKLDRFFIRPGISKDRDDKLLSSVITLARALKMTVSQEGVETVDDLRRLRDMGCDVIQGYIYEKPLPATDFLDFVQSGGSLRII